MRQDIIINKWGKFIMKTEFRVIAVLCVAALSFGCTTTGFDLPKSSFKDIKSSGTYCEITDPMQITYWPHLKMSKWWSGECRDGSPFGSGTLLTFSHETIVEQFIGQMRDGLLGPEKHGKGVLTSFLRRSLAEMQSDFDGIPRKKEKTIPWRYEGDFKNGRRTGSGIWRNEEGLIIDGTFVNGKPHGECFVTSPSGTSQNVEFDNGKIVR